MFNGNTTMSAITIGGSNISIIGNSSFQGCSGLTSITIPTSVTTIRTSAFQSCIKLRSITIPSGVSSLGNSAFQNCSGLNSITIPATLTSNNAIGTNAFAGIYTNTVTIDGSSTGISIPISMFNGNTTTTAIRLGSNITIIGTSAFQGCSGLTSINIPTSIISIGTNAFQSCSGLTSIKIPISVTSIGAYAFQGCSNLTEITIHQRYETIYGSNAFSNIPTFPPKTTLEQAATLYYINEQTYTQFFTGYNFGNKINYDDQTFVCFKEDSKILTENGYIPIQDLRKGDLIKTIKHGYVAIDTIAFREVYNPICEERIKDKLYVCTNKEYSEVFEDLIISGCHAILVDRFKEGEREKTSQVLGRIFVTDNKYRLPACVDERAKPYEKEGKTIIYHLALENKDYFMNYGIYANGLLVETCSKRYLKELSKMTVIT
jgi:hypothetical protein